MIQFAIGYIVELKVKRNRHRFLGSGFNFRVKGKERPEKTEILIKNDHLPKLIANLAHNFGLCLTNEAEDFLVNRHPKCSPGTRMGHLAQTWHVKVW